MVKHGGGFERAAGLLPPRLRERALGLPEGDKARAEELRLRAGRSATVLFPGGEREFYGDAVTARDLAAVIEIATGASAHTASESVRRGFITVKGGCRVGLCGSAVVDGGGVKGIKNLSSVAIRVPKEVRGCADGLFGRLVDDGFKSTLIIAPPGGGKTTLLRELIRKLSQRKLRISLADERDEVAAVWEGEAQFDIGGHTDVLSGAPKAEACMMLLRSMNPQILALDEITAPEDVRAIETAANCGVALLATAHGASAQELWGRNLYRELLEKRIFENFITISGSGSGRTASLSSAEDNLPEASSW